MKTKNFALLALASLSFQANAHAADCTMSDMMNQGTSVSLSTSALGASANFRTMPASAMNEFTFAGSTTNNTTNVSITSYGPNGFNCVKNYKSVIFRVRAPFPLFQQPEQAPILSGMQSCLTLFSRASSGAGFSVQSMPSKMLNSSVLYTEYPTNQSIEIFVNLGNTSFGTISCR